MENTGYKGFNRLREKNRNTGEYTGVTKINDPQDPDYVAPVYDPNYCEEGPLYITPDSEQFNVGYEAGVITIQIASNTEWGVSNLPYWATTPLGATGIHDGSLSIEVEANSGGERDTTVPLKSSDGSISVLITITQAAELQLEHILLSQTITSNSYACSRYNSGYTSSFYTDTTTFDDATIISLNTSGSNLAPTGYYSDGLSSRYWNQNMQVLSSPQICEINFK